MPQLAGTRIRGLPTPYGTRSKLSSSKLEDCFPIKVVDLKEGGTLGDDAVIPALACSATQRTKAGMKANVVTATFLDADRQVFEALLDVKAKAFPVLFPGDEFKAGKHHNYNDPQPSRITLASKCSTLAGIHSRQSRYACMVMTSTHSREHMPPRATYNLDRPSLMQADGKQSCTSSRFSPMDLIESYLQVSWWL